MLSWQKGNTGTSRREAERSPCTPRPLWPACPGGTTAARASASLCRTLQKGKNQLGHAGPLLRRGNPRHAMLCFAMLRRHAMGVAGQDASQGYSAKPPALASQASCAPKPMLAPFLSSQLPQHGSHGALAALFGDGGGAGNPVSGGLPVWLALMRWRYTLWKKSCKAAEHMRPLF
jgi:hypothetical protein